MAKTKKRSDKRYCKTVVIGIRPDGKLKRKYIYGHTRDELDKNYREFMSLFEKGVILTDSRLTVCALFDMWRNMNLKPEESVSSKKVYQTFRNNLERSELGGMLAENVKKYNILTFLNGFIAAGKTDTAKKSIKRLQQMFALAESMGFVKSNPCTGITVNHKPKKKRPLSEFEKKRLDTVPMDLKDQALIKTLRYTGMRRCELFALEKGDIDFENGIIHICREVVDDNGKPVIIDHTKTPAGIREVPIFTPLRQTLHKYCSSINTDLLFPNARGNYFAPASIDWLTKRYRKQFGLMDDFSLHLFRHNFASECSEAGVSVKLVQAWVGHDDIKTTLDIYTHLSTAYIRDGSVMEAFYAKNAASNVVKMWSNKLSENYEAL